MIIDKVHHPLRFLTISLSYGRSLSAFFCLLLSGGLGKGSGGAFCSNTQGFFSSHQRGVVVFKSMSLFMFGSRAQRTRQSLRNNQGKSIDL